MALLNRVGHATSTTGTGTVTLGSALSSHFTVAEAGGVDGTTYTYLIEDGFDFEIGRGVYTASGTTLTRATVIGSKISGTAGTSKINLSGSATVKVTAAKEDLASVGSSGDLTLESTDAGAAAGPIVTLYRNSASPAASDIIGQVLFTGEDSAGNTQTYAHIEAKITDPTHGSEDSELILAAIEGGTIRTLALNGDSFRPTSTSVSLGDGTDGWFGLFLKSLLDGAVVSGRIQYDGISFVGEVGNNTPSRGVIPSQMFTSRTSASSALANNTNQQAIFPSAADTLTVEAATSYFFEAYVALDTMSATSGNVTFSIGSLGTATFTSAKWQAVGQDATTLTTAAAAGGSQSTSAVGTGNVVTAAVGTAVTFLVTGIFRVDAAGTIIPSVALTTAVATAIVQQNSWFRCWPIGDNTVVSSGLWA